MRGAREKWHGRPAHECGPPAHECAPLMGGTPMPLARRAAKSSPRCLQSSPRVPSRHFRSAKPPYSIVRLRRRATPRRDCLSGDFVARATFFETRATCPRRRARAAEWRRRRRVVAGASRPRRPARTPRLPRRPRPVAGRPRYHPAPPFPAPRAAAPPARRAWLTALGWRGCLVGFR